MIVIIKILLVIFCVNLSLKNEVKLVKNDINIFFNNGLSISPHGKIIFLLDGNYKKKYLHNVTNFYWTIYFEIFQKKKKTQQIFKLNSLCQT